MYPGISFLQFITMNALIYIAESYKSTEANQELLNAQ